VVEVVTEPHVGGGRLGRDRLEGRVGLQGAHDGGPAVVGYAQHADSAVILRDILEEPVDGIVRIGALIQGLRVSFITRRALHDEGPLGAELAADVLEDEEVTFLGQRPVIGGEEALGTSYAIGGPPEDDREVFGPVFRLEDPGVQANAVAHRDHGFGDEEAGVLRRRCRGPGCQEYGEEEAAEEESWPLFHGLITWSLTWAA
jgi:hypothetical protein